MALRPYWRESALPDETGNFHLTESNVFQLTRCVSKRGGIKGFRLQLKKALRRDSHTSALIGHYLILSEMRVVKSLCFPVIQILQYRFTDEIADGYARDPQLDVTLR